MFLPLLLNYCVDCSICVEVIRHRFAFLFILTELFSIILCFYVHFLDLVPKKVKNFVSNICDHALYSKNLKRAFLCNDTIFSRFTFLKVLQTNLFNNDLSIVCFTLAFIYGFDIFIFTHIKEWVDTNLTKISHKMYLWPLQVMPDEEHETLSISNFFMTVFAFFSHHVRILLIVKTFIVFCLYQKSHP